MRHLLNLLLRSSASAARMTTVCRCWATSRKNAAPGSRVAAGDSRPSRGTQQRSFGAFVWGLRDAFMRRAFALRDAQPDRHRLAARGQRCTLLSWPDIKLSLRLLIRNPGLTVVSTVGIAVGIAITAGMFGFFHANFDPTLPLDEGDRIVALENWDIVEKQREPSVAARLRDLAGSDDVRRRDQRVSQPSARRCRRAIGCPKPCGSPR